MSGEERQFCKENARPAVPSQADLSSKGIVYNAGAREVFEFGSFRVTRDQVYADALQQPTVERAMDVIRAKRPREFCLNYESLKRTFTRKLRERNIAEQPPRQPKTFKFLPFTDKKTLASKVIVIIGKSGAGKTQWALDHFQYPLNAQIGECLKEINPRTDGIVFDNFEFKKWSLDLCKRFLNMEKDCCIRVKYASAWIMAGMPRIITANATDPMDLFPPCDGKDAEAIKERIKVINVTEKLF